MLATGYQSVNGKVCGYENYIWKEGRSVRFCQIRSNADKLFYCSDPILMPFEEDELFYPHLLHYD
jgi:hypothetical protein